MASEHSELNVLDIILKEFGEFQNIVLKEQQVAAIKRTLNGKDTLLMAPTGFGKSVIYQALPYAKRSLHSSKTQTSTSDPVGAHYCVLVVSPLDALIRDSIRNIDSLIPKQKAVHLKPGVLKDISGTADYAFMFSTPETICSAAGKQLVRRLGNQLVAVFVDECHCITQWGKEDEGKSGFREAYSQIGELRSLTAVPFLAVTATASPKSVDLITRSLCLHMNDGGLIRVSANKTNITYFVHKLAGSLPLSMRWLGRYTDNSNTGRALVFFNTVAELASVYSLVTSEIRDTKAIQMYHQSTPDSVKSSILDDMAKPDGNIKVLLCSTSLSMGLNLCNINLAICVGPPESAEMFLQETGRVARHSSTRGQGIVLTFKGMTRRVTNMKDFLEGVMCKRTSLLKELGEVVTTRLDSCCDICTTDAVSMLADYVCNVSDDISEPITT